MYIYVYTMEIQRSSLNMLQIKTPIDGQEIHMKEVKKFGNGAKIDFLKRFIGKKVIVVVLKDD